MITGAGGQLGRQLAGLLVGTASLCAYSREQLNVADSESVHSVVWREFPDVIIHCAAYTQVDLAQSHAETAYAINAIGSRNVAAAASACGSVLVYVSTDYVFDGNKSGQYNEFDQPHPINIYGASKYEGERFVRMLINRFFIVRTSWLYSRDGNNFASRIIAAAREGKPLRAACDEVGSPTYTKDLAEFIIALIRTNRYGIYHVSNSGACSRYEFARAVLDEAGYDGVGIAPVPGISFRTPAKRPKNSAFDHLMIRLGGFAEMPHWRDAVARCWRDDS